MSHFILIDSVGTPYNLQLEVARFASAALGNAYDTYSADAGRLSGTFRMSVGIRTAVVNTGGNFREKVGAGGWSVVKET